jgi:hypothetical protein
MSIALMRLPQVRERLDVKSNQTVRITDSTRTSRDARKVPQADIEGWKPLKDKQAAN